MLRSVSSIPYSGPGSWKSKEYSQAVSLTNILRDQCCSASMESRENLFLLKIFLRCRCKTPLEVLANSTLERREQCFNYLVPSRWTLAESEWGHHHVVLLFLQRNKWTWGLGKATYQIATITPSMSNLEHIVTPLLSRTSAMKFEPLKRLQ